MKKKESERQQQISDAEYFCDLALERLKQIDPEDPEREEHLLRVLAWIDKKSNKAPKRKIRKENKNTISYKFTGAPKPGLPEENEKGEIIFPCYTFMPPKKHFEYEELEQLPAHISDLALQAALSEDMYMALTTKSDVYKETGNPIYLIEAFLLAYQLGLYPPPWVLAVLAEAFQEFYDSQGRKSVETLLGLTGRGKTPPYKKALQRDRDEKIMMDVFRLIRLGYPLERAADMVCLKRDHMKAWDRTGLNLKALDAPSVVTVYRKNWKKVFEESKYFTQCTDEWLKKNKEAFLQSFPREAFSLRS
jgi:hypothetical protein